MGKIGGCDGHEDTVCGPPDDFVGTVSTGKPGASDGCMCDSTSVATDFMSRTAWFFRFYDVNQSDVFPSSSVVDGPCKEEACDMTTPFFGDRIGFSNSRVPSTVQITGEGCDGWCMSRICVASSKLGKRYVWSGMQWMNPCAGGSNATGANTTGSNSTEAYGTVEPCAGVAWPAMNLIEEPYGDCSVAVRFTDDKRWNQAWTASNPANTSDTANNTNSSVSGSAANWSLDFESNPANTSDTANDTNSLATTTTTSKSVRGRAANWSLDFESLEEVQELADELAR